MLPKIIHQIIIGDKQNKVIKRCLSSWKTLTKRDFEIRVWNRDTIQSFVQENYPFALDIVLTARNYAELSDIARYLIIYHYGGHYYDYDIQLLDLDLFSSLHEDNTSGFLLEDLSDGAIACEGFCASPSEPYLHKLVKDIVEIYEKGDREKLHTIDYSGPFRMRDSLRKSQTRQNIIPVNDVFLYSYHEIKEMPERAINRPMIHYWIHSWL